MDKRQTIIIGKVYRTSYFSFCDTRHWNILS